MSLQSCLTLDSMDCNPPDFSVHGILQARILEWGAISFSRGSSPTRDQTWVSHIVGRRFTVWSYLEFSPWSFIPEPLEDAKSRNELEGFFLVHIFWSSLTPILGLMFSYAKQTCILAEFPWHRVMWEWDGGKLYDFERKLAFVKALFGVCHNCTCISCSVLQRNFLLRVKMFQLKLFSTRGKCLRAQPLLAQEHCFIHGDWNSNFLWEAFAIETNFDFRSKCFDFKGGIQESQLLLIAPRPFIVVLL